jgi:hypothetical protein
MTILRTLALAAALSVFGAAVGCKEAVEDPTEVASAACTSDGAGACTTGDVACRDWPGYTCCAVAAGCACVSDSSRCGK